MDALEKLGYTKHFWSHLIDGEDKNKIIHIKLVYSKEIYSWKEKTIEIYDDKTMFTKSSLNVDELRACAEVAEQYSEMLIKNQRNWGKE